LPSDRAELFGSLLKQESVHPDDASHIIIYAAWERLNGKHADQPAPHDHDPPAAKRWWQFWS
jgi:hypothetical protein